MMTAKEKLRKGNMEVDFKEKVVRVRLDLNFYPKKEIFSATYRLSGMAHTLFEPAKDHVTVLITPKDPKADLLDLGYHFNKVLIHELSGYKLTPPPKPGLLDKIKNYFF